MKVDATTPVFAPVTITLESAGEVQFFFDVFGNATGSMGELYGLGHEFMYDNYRRFKTLCEERGISYAGKINVESKDI